MKTSYLFLAEGFEETEALGTLDVMRRAGLTVNTVSINSTREVTSSHGVTVVADTVIADINPTPADTEWLICPGGMPGAVNLYQCAKVADLLAAQYAAGAHVAAICASPAVVFAPLGILENRRATCYPGMEELINSRGTVMTGEGVVVDGNVITGRGPAYTFAFGLAIVAETLGQEAADTVAAGMLLK